MKVQSGGDFDRFLIERPPDDCCHVLLRIISIPSLIWLTLLKVSMYLSLTLKFAAPKFVEYLCGDRQGLNIPFGGTSVKYKTITSAVNETAVIQHPVL